MIKFDPLPSSVMTRLVKLLPHMAEAKDSEELEKIMEGSLLRLLNHYGFTEDEFDDDTFIKYIFHSTSAAHDTVTADEWVILTTELSSEQFVDFVRVWNEWLTNEAFALFQKDYQVKELSQWTSPRWHEFRRVWGELVADDLRAIFDDYYENSLSDPTTPFEWQLQFATGGWNNDVEVPFVKPAEGEKVPEEAVPRGADGKPVKI